ncbi:MAG: helical backbone metal receptor, partial [Bacteroidales bacterium]
MKRAIALIRNFSFVLIGLMFACNSPRNESAGNFFQWTDSYGREVKLSHEPQRIISLSPSITEMIFLLQAEEKLVGISDYCQYPPETNKIKRVGGLQNINVESLLALQPDVVLIGSIVPKK